MNKKINKRVSENAYELFKTKGLEIIALTPQTFKKLLTM